MKGTQIKIETHGSDIPVIGQIIDIAIHDKAEYVIIKLPDQQSKEIRLDKILTLTPL